MAPDTERYQIAESIIVRHAKRDDVMDLQRLKGFAAGTKGLFDKDLSPYFVPL